MSININFSNCQSRGERTTQIGKPIYLFLPDGEVVFDDNYRGDGIVRGQGQFFETDIFEELCDANLMDVKAHIGEYKVDRSMTMWGDIPEFIEEIAQYDSLEEQNDAAQIWLLKHGKRINADCGMELENFRHILGVIFATCFRPLRYPVKVSTAKCGLPYNMLSESIIDESEELNELIQRGESYLAFSEQWEKKRTMEMFAITEREEVLA